LAKKTKSIPFNTLQELDVEDDISHKKDQIRRSSIQMNQSQINFG